ncbi:proton-conducting transporter membrane subunit [uncultured Nitrosomonas sp.]|uniref:proton-conducting transporter transmembrane domain-containing protein n=1 Tax=uncultured Nitrosomonas sp. TaxID=156424 RepID=UPI0025DC7A6F|nr:proton-conducting transporter membrane subunit [uncultured Nitrosomonas sp.]
MDFLVVLIPLIPLLAAIYIGSDFLFNKNRKGNREAVAALVARSAVSISCVLAITLLVSDLSNNNDGFYHVGQWLGSKNLSIDLLFITSGYSVIVATLFSVILVVVTRFSTFYLFKEPGFIRYLFIFCLFSTGMMLITLSGNAVITFIGWEMAGLCSYFLISFAYDRPVATINATRVFVTNRIGDASFILGIALSFYYLGTTNWLDINDMADLLTTATATVIALSFAGAAFAKSAQLPFSPWLARAMEGPTPSSAVFYGAVMIHSGIFLIILLQPIFEKAPFVMALLVVVGLFTALYSFIIGLTQTDVKSSICFAITGQIGLMVAECGLGFWELASWHLCAHVIVRGYQVLTSPSLVFSVNGNPMRQVSSHLGNKRWLYNISLQRFWLDPIADRTLVRPISGLGKDLDYFDNNFIDRVMGSPASAATAISSLTQLEQKISPSEQNNDLNKLGRGRGFAGKLLEWMAGAMSWFEERLVLRGIGIEMVDIGKQLGHAANTFEKLLLKSRYLVLFVFVVLMIASSI